MAPSAKIDTQDGAFGPTLVSVIIPAFNAERFLTRTLRSVLAQTYENLEIIVVNDGSTDSTEAIAKQAATLDSRIQVITTSNGGVARARNLGIERAAGTFVAFVDADDLWHPCKIELQITALTRVGGVNPMPVAAYALSRIIDLDDRVVADQNRRVFSGYTFTRHLFTKPVGNGSSLLVRREVAIAVGAFDPSYADRGIGGCEDIDFELRLAARHPIVGIPRYLVGYRVYRGNMSSNRLSMASSMLAVVTKCIDSHPELQHFARQSAMIAAHEYAFWALVGGGHWQRAFTILSTLLSTDLSRGTRFVSEAFKAKARRIRSTRIMRERVSARIPFSELAPDADTTLIRDPMQRMNERTLERLRTIDESMAISLDTERPRATFSAPQSRPISNQL